MNILPKNLFDKRILEYKIHTTKLGLVNYVNLDNAATTPPFKCVEEGVKNYLTTYGSVHRGAGTKSKTSTDIYEKSRETIKNFVSAPKDSYVLFTGNTTGGMNTLAYFFSFLKGKIAVSEIEHSSSWLPWVKDEGVKALGSEQVDFPALEKINMEVQESGRRQVVRYSINNQGEFDLDSIEKILKENNIKAFILTASSNVTGYCPDIKKIGELVHKYKAWYVIDGCQYIQHHLINMRDCNIDFLVASGHKFYAPYGGGFVVGPKKFFDSFLPYQIGGGNLPYITGEGKFLRYENQLAHDPGTPNAIGAVSMAIALDKLSEIGVENIANYEKKLVARVYAKLEANPKVELFVSRKHLNTILTFNIKGISAGDLAERLNNEYGIGVRAGSFCAYEMLRKLLSIRDDSQIVRSVKAGDSSKIPGVVRASFSLCNTEADADRFIEAVERITSNDR
jgi:cysteine desulfurase / selenocysteine lyase